MAYALVLIITSEHLDVLFRGFLTTWRMPLTVVVVVLLCGMQYSDMFNRQGEGSSGDGESEGL